MSNKPCLAAAPHLALILLLGSVATAWSQEPSTHSPYRPASTRSSAAPGAADQPSPPIHAPSVASALEWGQLMLQRLESVEDYECVFTKRERIAGKLGEHQQMLARVRHQPFSVYLKFVAPESLANREVVWVDGQNQGKLRVKSVGWQAALGTITLDPESSVAMQGNLHPISDIGIRNLARKMIAGTRNDARHGDLEIQCLRPAKVAGQTCTCIQFDNPSRRDDVQYCRSRIFVDEESKLPIRFEGYTWPDGETGEPLLIEEYTYTRLKLNNGFTDRDFSL